MSINVALAAFVEVWSDGMLLSEIGPRLTCREADALADLLNAEGWTAAADLLIDAHAEQDDEGDTHHRPRCEADTLSGTGTGLCDRLLDEHGICPGAARHVETLAPL